MSNVCLSFYCIHSLTKQKISSNFIPGMAVKYVWASFTKINLLYFVVFVREIVESKRKKLFKKKHFCVWVVSVFVMRLYPLLLKAFDPHFWIYVVTCALHMLHKPKREGHRKKCNGSCAFFAIPSDSFFFSFFGPAACFIHAY